MLEHIKTDCTGEWRLLSKHDLRQIACSGCEARFTATPARRRAAVDENLAGKFLRRLTQEGGELADLDDVA